MQISRVQITDTATVQPQCDHIVKLLNLLYRHRTESEVTAAEQSCLSGIEELLLRTEAVKVSALKPPQ